MKNTVQDFVVWAASLEDSICDAKEFKHIGYLVSLFLEELDFEDCEDL